MHYQWVPAHVGIEGNEVANSLANNIQSQSTIAMQMQHGIKPDSLKTFLHQYEKQKFIMQATTDNHHHSGYRLLSAGIKRTNFQERQTMPRALQCLFSRWRCGQVDSCGGYARHLGFLADDGSLCRFCCQAKESPFHLCTTCMAFTTYRWVHNISLDTLFYDSPRNILAIATFDNYISQTLPYIQQPPIQQPLSNIIQIA